MYCRNCGCYGPAKRKTQGNFFIELVLWFTFIIPGLIYSIWRLSTKTDVCRNCGSENIIPEDSPMLAAKQESKKN